MKSKCSYLIVFLFLLSFKSFAQDNKYSCQNDAYQYLQKIAGIWNVKTKDRISPGNYETNSGKSKITDLISGCSVKESYKGTYRGKSYARESMIIGVDSTRVQLSILDSEHNSFSILSGKIKNDKMIVYWYRNKDLRKLQSKYILTLKSNNSFEFTSFLSTDYGETWALTHKRDYSRIK
jgi:hypothetical protein